MAHRATSNSSTSPVVIPDDVKLLQRDGKNQPFLYPPEYEGHLLGVLISNDDIIQRTKELAKKISSDYCGKRPLLVCLLKGAGAFYHNLQMALQRERQGYCCEFIRAKSYEGTDSTGAVHVTGMKFKEVANQHVILIEDIVDTGTTISKIIPMLLEESCLSVEVCTLLEKRIKDGSHQTKVDCKYAGFSIPKKFVVGHGLDYNELYRDLADIWIISEEGIKKGRKD